jgi:hypothetical protein
MKKNAAFCFLCFLLFACTGKKENNTATQPAPQNDTNLLHAKPLNPYAEVDLSPMDMAYFPVDYPKLKMANTIATPPVMRVIYSRPHRGGRIIFGNLLKYGEQWRLGANEATEIEFFREVIIQHKKIKPGRYLVYCIPFENKWTIILNSNIYTWGLKIDASKDLERFDIPVSPASVNFEYFTMAFEKTATGADLIMAWDDTEARLPINL